MCDISKVDKNFAVKPVQDIPNRKFWNIEEPPFQVYGIFKENGKYRRMPESVAQSVSQSVYLLHTNTAGGRVRFQTDSPFVTIYAQMDGIGRMPHFALTGAAGFDLYADGQYAASFVPPYDMENGYEGSYYFETEGMHEVTMHFPLYSNVKQLYIGLHTEAAVAKSFPYKNEKPVVFYGSSITQGGCAARPGMSYQNILARRLHMDYINLGFSGSAKAEEPMVAYIQNLDMSVFVYDYDHNAPTAEYLENTHEKMFLSIRKKKPDLPVIMLPRPKYTLTEDEQRREKIVQKTYENAVARGDKQVYFLDHSALTKLCCAEGTVDGCHPTDFGFWSMANALSDILQKIM